MKKNETSKPNTDYTTRLNRTNRDVDSKVETILNQKTS